MNNPILSICIPTYNRSNYLEDTIVSIVKQRCFIETNNVEIVISDNCSTDNTQEIGEKYAKLCEGKVRYFRNSENIKDLNFEKALSYGNGDYLKLNNDTLNHSDGSLNLMLESIQNSLDSKRLLYFTNNSIKDYATCITTNFNEFVDRVSFGITWIGGFGLWKSDFNSIVDFSRSSKLQLTQVDVLLSQVAKNGHVYIDNRALFISIEPKNKGGYNIYQVFVNNYFSILERYIDSGVLSRWTLFKEKYRVMRNFVIPWTLKIIFYKDVFTFSTEGAWSILFKNFGKHPYFYIGLFRFSRKYISKEIGNFFKN